MMKYDLLNAYKDYLLTSYRPQTANTYYKKLCTLFEGQSFSYTSNNLNIDKIMEKLGKIKHKNHFSQSKNAFLRFCEFLHINLSVDTLELIKELEENTRKKYRKLKPVEFNQVDKKIKHIKNKKLKLCFQTIVATGFRISELASITSNNCTIADDGITFAFIGKGGASEVIELQASTHPKLYQSLKELIESTSMDKRIFYSANYLQRQTKELGFGCHDLRRIYAKLEYKKSKSKRHVMKKLRHSSIKTTNIYLRSKVKI